MNIRLTPIKALFNVPILFFALALINAASASTDSEANDKQLNFKVFLDANEIGYHRVNIQPTNKGEQISIESKFDVKFLFFNAYSYLHTAEEQWKNECLESIKSETIENKDEMFVRSKSTTDGIAISSHQAETSLTGCIKSFAYWDYQRLDSKRLLNAQTGEYVRAKFSALGEVIYEREGNSVTAKKFLLQAEDAEINLWYSLDNEWLALQTEVKGGRVLAYHRIMENSLAKNP